MTAIAFIGLAVLGTLARAALSRLNPQMSTPELFSARTAGFPIGTFAANVTGAFALGLAVGQVPDEMVLIGTGLLGSFTTLSTVANETVQLAARSRLRTGLYLAATLIAGVAAAWAGLEIGA